LGWTPPAVSQHLAALEKSVAIPLIHRHHGGVQLTPAGALLVQHADTIADTLETAIQDMAELVRHNHRTVRLACCPSSMTGLVPTALSAVQSSPMPTLDIHLTEAEPTEATELLRSGQADVALVFDYVEAAQPLDLPAQIGQICATPSDLVGVDVGGDEVVIVLSKHHPLAATSDISLLDFAEFKWIISSDLCRSYLELSATPVGFQPRIVHQTHHHNLVQSLILHDPQATTAAIVPTSQLPSYGQAGLAVRSVPELLNRRFVALYRPGGDGIPTVARFLDCLIKAARDSGAKRAWIASGKAA
jgi:DNA-binding transcriptional LysR family regulator